MSVSLMSEVWKSGLKGNLKYTALAYADHANDEGAHIYPSIDYLAWKTGQSPRTIQRNTKELVQMGIMVVVVKGGNQNGYGLANEYRMISSKLPKREPFRKGDKTTPLVKEKGDILSEKGDILSEKGDKMSPQPSYNHHINHHEEEEAPQLTPHQRGFLDHFTPQAPDIQDQYEKILERYVSNPMNHREMSKVTRILEQKEIDPETLIEACENHPYEQLWLANIPALLEKKKATNHPFMRPLSQYTRGNIQFEQLPDDVKSWIRSTGWTKAKLGAATKGKDLERELAHILGKDMTNGKSTRTQRGSRSGHSRIAVA